MAYYTFAHLLQGGRLNGDVKGPLGIAPEDLTDDVFDYVCCLSEKRPAGSSISDAGLDEMRREFKYWYPMNLRCSGKDLIQNHLTMSLFNHAAIWQDPKFWPRGFFTNGHVLVDAEKMSKSKGNFLTLKQTIDDFSADATRMACADAGDTIEDANFSRETANNTILRLTTLETWAVEAVGKMKGEYRTGELTFLDQVFVNEISRLVNETHAGFTKMVYRDAVKASWFEMLGARDEYRNLAGDDLHSDCVRLWLEVLAIILSPVCPHMCEHLWSFVLENKGLVCEQLWPKLPKEDRVVSRKYAVLNGALRAFRLEKEKATKGKNPLPTSKATVFVAKEYLPFQQVVLKVLDTVELDADNVPVEKDFMRKLQQHPDIQGLPKDQAKGAMPFANFVMANDVKARGKEALALELPFDERAMYEERMDVIVRQLKVEELTFASPSDPCAADPKNKRALATPSKPVIVFYE
jgi:leucyl-tRNA synthetase